MTPQSSVVVALQELLEREPMLGELSVSFGDFRVRIHANDLKILSALAKYYEAFRAKPALEFLHDDVTVRIVNCRSWDPGIVLSELAPEPGKHHAKEAYADTPVGRIVRKTRTDMVFIQQREGNLIIGPAAQHLNQAVNFINNLHIGHRLRQGDLIGHAAGLVLRDQGIAIAGVSGAGKSTIALHAMNQGATFVSNDRLLFSSSDEGVCMQGVAKYPRVNPGTLLRNRKLQQLLSAELRSDLQSMPDQALQTLERKFDVPLHSIYGKGCFLLSSELHALLILTWSFDAVEPFCAHLVDGSRRSTLIQHLMKRSGVFASYHAGLRSPHHVAPVEDYLELLRATPWIEFSGRIDFKQGVDYLKSLKYLSHT